LPYIIVGQTGQDVYPMVWVVKFVTLERGPNWKLTTEFGSWIHTDGQRYSDACAFARLPEEIIGVYGKK
jgi:hypothetical protein